MQQDKWQVEVNGQIYDATFDELKAWIAERSLLPTDMVRKGQLRWVQAERVPALRPYFSGDAAQVREAFSSVPIEAIPVSTNSATFGSLATESQMPFQSVAITENHFNAASENNFNAEPANPSACLNHPEAAPAFLCKQCSNRFCKNCPKAFGTIRICPVCGEMCEPVAEVVAKVEKAQKVWHSQTGFGFEDLGHAITFPFKFSGSLLLGALFYALLLMGGLFGGLLANMLLFGSIAQTIGQIAHGNLDRNFMPDFDDFNVWDDVIHPWFLGIGVTIVSWGPLILLIGAMFLGALSFLMDAHNKSADARLKESIEQPAPQPFEIPQNTKKRSLEEMLGEDNRAAPGAKTAINQGQTTASNQDGDLMQDLIDGRDPEKSEAAARKLEEMARDSRKIPVERPKAEHEMMWETFSPLMQAAIPLIILFVLAFFWGIFYSPIALAIAGYTRSFTATVNPLVGIDTIKRMGGTYLKAFLMLIGIKLVEFFIAMIIAFITAPFNLPLIGNLPANFIGSIFVFYFSLVVACLLGLALFKSADKLAIEIG